ncbi:MAG TPA: sulfurtransferase TusA family protein [Nitrospirae bacterium]|nr:sulfurtransferase TusA family protein [Nitrospirota bacterium]
MIDVRIDKVLDVKGLICPRPMIMTMSTLKSMVDGQVLKVICNDVTTKHSIPGLCERSAFKLLEMKDEDGLISFVIQK